MTEEDLRTLREAQDNWAALQTGPTKLYKSTFIRRLTASEATDLEQVLNTEEAYIRLLYNSVEWFDVSDALVSYLHLTLTAAYGAERADELLAPEA